AGSLDDGVFFRKDAARTSAVLAPKLHGATNLDLATEDDDLEIFVLFSSLAAVVPNPGQSDYAYANAFLDHFARLRARRPTHSGVTVAIDWPYWAEGGMRADPAGGEEPLPTDAGFAALDALLQAGESQITVA